MRLFSLLMILFISVMLSSLQVDASGCYSKRETFSGQGFSWMSCAEDEIAVSCYSLSGYTATTLSQQEVSSRCLVWYSGDYVFGYATCCST